MNEIKVSLDIPITQEIEWYIKAKLPDLLNEAIFDDDRAFFKGIRV